MTSIANLFSNFTDLVKPKSVTDNVSDYNKNNSNPISLSLNQGRKFKKYQGKIKSNLAEEATILSGVEGFQKLNIKPGPGDTLTKQTIDVLQKTNISQNQQQILGNLRTEYASTMTEYENLLATVSGGTSDYINRVNPNNPYLGKMIQLLGGALFYVTNQGIAKQIPSMDVYSAVSGQNGFPAYGDYIPGSTINISWDNSYSTPGSTLPTTPPLVIGTPVQVGQSVGNEGSNVYVNTMISNPVTSYQGCYADNAAPPPTMTFIGGAPPPTSTVSIVNGNFTEPSIANNTYQYISDGSTVPGWWFDAVIINNSSAWGYPMPYPFGSQAVSIQEGGYMSQNVNLQSGTTYTLTFSACGRNCCDGSGLSNPINISLYTNDNVYIASVYDVQPQVNVWSNYTTSFTVQTTQNTKIFFSGGWTSSDRSSAIQNIQLGTDVNSSQGSYTYSMCKEAAINGGYQYFALQNVNTGNSQGYCAVSNDAIAPTQNGTSYIAKKQIALWSSQTSGQTGNTCSFNNGSLSVLNSSGAAVFATPNSTQAPSNYIGCYGDSSTRAMPLYNNGSQQYNNSQCQQIAQQQGATYYGLQDSTSGTNAQCALSSDLGQAQEYGIATNCTQISDGSWSGGGWSNAVYSTTNPTNNYFLILQDDGNLCIYLGSGPNDNQGGIWCAMTDGQQQQGNPLMVAANNKFGQNWMPNGSALAPGEYLSSTNGNLALMMQSDGNLVLYTFQMAENCQKMADGKKGGGVGANALYELNEVGVPANLAQLGYVDQDSQLHTYPSTNMTYTNTYTTMTGTDSQGYDISGAAYGNATVAQCQTSCNNNTDCAGFAFSNNVCYPKTSSMYPVGQMEVNPNVDLYLRNVTPASPPIGVSTNTNNIDTVLYQNYINGGAIDESYGLSQATSVQKQQLQQMQTKLNLLSNQINNLTNQFTSGGQQVNQQSETNIQGINTYVKDIKKINKKIKNYDTTYENILQDSDVVVLQQNYDYLFWSIIAVTTVIISMNIVKK
jgi:hypothetical protein